VPSDAFLVSGVEQQVSAHQNQGLAALCFFTGTVGIAIGSLEGVVRGPQAPATVGC